MSVWGGIIGRRLCEEHMHPHNCASAFVLLTILQAPSSGLSSSAEPPTPETVHIAGAGMALPPPLSGGSGGQSQQPPPPPPSVLGEPRGELEAVTALGFSVVTSASTLRGGGGADNGPPALWLLAGHCSGIIVVWDLQRRPARQLLIICECQIRLYWLIILQCFLTPLFHNLPVLPPLLPAAGQHSLPVTHVSFFPGRGTSSALSVDRRSV